MSTPTITRVEIVESDGSLTVQPYWSGEVARPQGVGYAVGNAKLAERLRKAMLDQVVFYDAAVKTDINGKTYVSARSRVLGRILNADLKHLGY